MTRNEKINYVLRLMVIGFSLAVLYHGWMRYLGAGYPYDTFLFRSTDISVFGDFWTPWRRAGLPYAFQDRDGIYPPLAYVLLHILQHIERTQALLFFLGSSLTGFLLLGGYSLRDSRPLTTVSRALLVTCCSYPFWFALNRANLEIWAFEATFLWVYFYRRGRHKAALICLALALNLKPFTVLLSMLYLAHRQWRSLAALVALSSLFFMLSLSLIPGEAAENIWHLASNFEQYNAHYAAHSAGLVMGHSLFGVLKLGLASFTPGGPMLLDATTLMKPYLVATLLGLCGIILFLARVKLQWWAQLMLLVGALDLLPYVSADYKLLYVLLPFFEWINTQEISPSPRYDSVVACLFALLLIPKNIGHPWGGEISLGTIFNPTLLLALCVVATRARVHSVDESRILLTS